MAKAPKVIQPQRLSADDRREVERELEQSIINLLRFKASHDVNLYIASQKSKTYERSDLELQLHVAGYPISGTGVVLNRTALTASRDDLSDYIMDDVPLEPETLTSELDLYPYDAASASYSFTVMETFGDYCIEKRLPSVLSGNAAWHSPISGKLNPAKRQDVLGARKEFAKRFSVAESRVPLSSVRRLITLKKERNAYAHDLTSDINFDEFFTDVILTMYQVAILIVPAIANEDLKVYPYYDHHGQFS